MIKRYLALLLASAIFVSQSLFSEETITTGTIDVYSSSPLPSIGLPKNMVPANIQTINSNELDAQSGVSIADFMDKIPNSVKKIAVLDRTKEPGATGEPLYMDTVSAFKGRSDVEIIGGRYGLSSKEFTPAMVKGIFDELDNNSPKNHFTIGINDPSFINCRIFCN